MEASQFPIRDAGPLQERKESPLDRAVAKVAKKRGRNFLLSGLVPRLGPDIPEAEDFAVLAGQVSQCGTLTDQAQSLRRRSIHVVRPWLWVLVPAPAPEPAENDSALDLPIRLPDSHSGASSPDISGAVRVHRSPRHSAEQYL